MKAVFDDRCPAWTKNIEHNIAFLRLQQTYLNEMLHRIGLVSIMDVYKCLGLAIDMKRLVDIPFKDLCWVYENGDWIDFGMKPDADKNVIYLDFNIDID